MKFSRAVAEAFRFAAEGLGDWRSQSSLHEYHLKFSSSTFIAHIHRNIAHTYMYFSRIIARAITRCQ
jgi:hypothetical protein